MKKKFVIVTKEELNSLNLKPEEVNRILSKPQLGYVNSSLREFSSGVLVKFSNESEPTHLYTVVEEVAEIAPQSCLSDSPIKPGDFIVSINNAKFITFKGRKHFGLPTTEVFKNEAVHSIHSEFSAFCKDGEEVEVIYLVKPKNARRNMMGTEDNTMEVKQTTIKIKYIYSLKEPAHIKKLEKLKAKNLVKNIKTKIFNQDHAIEQINNSILINRANLKDQNKPIGAYLLTGPTGVGKTEIAIQFAKELGFDFVRIDMSEYQESHSASSLIGAPPSYVGYGDKTILEQEIGDSGKNVVLLLDEMEKAHTDIQKYFLQAMDNAKLTLRNNKEVNFSNTLIIMTSNCGVVTQTSLGLNNSEEKKKLLSIDMRVVKRYFVPEFIGRLDGIVQFNPLGEDHALTILSKFVDEFNEKHLSDKGTQLKLTDEAKRELVRAGFNYEYGARPLKNILNKNIKVKVANLLLENDKDEIDSKFGDTILVEFYDNEYHIRFINQVENSKITIEECCEN